MSVIGTIKSWFKSVGNSKSNHIHEAHKGDKPPTKPEKPADKGGIGATKTTVEDAKKKSEQDWKGDA